MSVDTVADVVGIWAERRVMVDTLVSFRLAVARTLGAINADTTPSFSIKSLLVWTPRGLIGCTETRLFIDRKASRTLRRACRLAHAIFKLEGGLADGV